MRTQPRLWPAYLALLVPLLLLGWFGQHELQRLGNEASKTLEEHGQIFLRSADRTLREKLDARCGTLLDEVAGAKSAISTVMQKLVGDDGAVSDAFVLNGEGKLLLPRPAERSLPYLPFHRPAASPTLSAAELLELAGDVEGARKACEAYLAQVAREAGPGRDRDGRGRGDERLRATFMLAGLLKLCGEPDLARARYDEARQVAEREEFEGPTMAVLCRAGSAALSPSPQPRIDLLQAIAAGTYSAVADDSLTEIVGWLAKSTYPVPATWPPEASSATESAEAAVREYLKGRRFASDYERLHQETVRRLLAAQSTERVRYVLQSEGLGSSLLAMRECSSEERGRLEALLPAKSRGLQTPRWVGVRLSAPLALNAMLDPLLTPGQEPFSLAILDEFKSPILLYPAVSSEADAFVRVPDLDSVARLCLRAVPVNPEALVSSARSAATNRLLLLLALVAIGAGGAFFLVRSAARDREAARERMTFVSRVSHELRTPLSLIKMYAETVLLGRAKGDRDPRHCAGIIRREADRLTSMIERILDFSRSEEGKLRYQRERIDLSDLLLSVIDEYRPRVEDQGAKLAIEYTDGLWADVDAEAMYGAIVNLLENAVKYTPAGAPDRTVEFLLGRHGSMVRLEVKDRGVGIPESERDRVFAAFYRASTAGEVRGFGLGLSLVRHFVVNHGGTIEVLAREGGGTTMRIELPAAASAPVEADPSIAMPPALARTVSSSDSDEERN